MATDIAETGVAADELKQFVERLEHLEGELKAINDDKRDVYAEAKGRGFDVKAIKAIVRLRAKEPQELEEEEAILELYKSALGMTFSGASSHVQVHETKRHAPAREIAPTAAAPENAAEEMTEHECIAAADYAEAVPHLPVAPADELGW